MKKKTSKITTTTQFLYEMASLTMVLRGSWQRMMLPDVTDTVANHTFVVQMIGYFLAQMEQVDASKVVMMCLLHDIGEARSGEQHWVNKQYVKVYEQEVTDSQFDKLPFGQELKKIVEEYEQRTSPESIVAKDADLLAAILYLRQKEWQGSKEATRWLQDLPELRKRIKTESGKKLAEELYSQHPCEWQDNLYVAERRK